MGVLADVEQFFGKTDLYEVLKIEKTSTEREIKLAYYKVAKKEHPDVSKHENATVRFQTLSKVYAVLSDSEAKKLYDDCGEVADDTEAKFSQEKDWSAYWRQLFPPITLEDIEKFAETYRESDEEKEDMLATYKVCKGNINKMVEYIKCFRVPDDEERLRKIVLAAIELGTVPNYPVFTKESAKKRNRRHAEAENEAREAEELAEELGICEEGSLTAVIQKRQAQRAVEMDSFLDGLAAKYGKEKVPPASKSSKEKSKPLIAEPSETASVSGLTSTKRTAAKTAEDTAVVGGTRKRKRVADGGPR